jgi:MoxR-like ATPase
MPTIDAPVARSPVDLAAALADQVSGALIGDPTPLGLAVAAFVAGGHVLLEDVPGVGKTLMTTALATRAAPSGV